MTAAPWLKPTAAAVALAVAFGAGWAAQGWRKDLAIEKLAHRATSDELGRTREAVQDMAKFQKGLNDALSNFQAVGRANADAQRDLSRSLLDLRGVTAGLRGDFAGLPARIERASQPALAEYAAACTAVFESMAAGGGRLAEAGAVLARQAEGHAADARLMQEAWPRVERGSVAAGQRP